MKIGLTGGIACGKSLLSVYLKELGFDLLDADDIVHELIPEAERRRLARTVFADPQARAALEARIHPLVRERIRSWLNVRGAQPRIAVVPLLFEVHWESEFDIIVCVASSREHQIERMTCSRGYSREEAEARLAAQLPVSVKAEKSHYVIRNDGSSEQLQQEAQRFAGWVKEQTNGR